MRQGISGDTRSCSLGAVGLPSPSFRSLSPGNLNFLTLFQGGKSVLGERRCCAVQTAALGCLSQGQLRGVSKKNMEIKTKDKNNSKNPPTPQRNSAPPLQ